MLDFLILDLIHFCSNYSKIVDNLNFKKAYFAAGIKQD
jgi:hypothetical protein